MLIATYALPHDAVGLAETFEALPDLTVEVERIAAHSTEWVMPCLWAAVDDPERVGEVLAADPSVADVVESHDFADETYYQVEWSPAVRERVDLFLDKDGSILEARADADGWTVEVRFASRDGFDRFGDALRDRDLDYRLLNLTEPGSPREAGGEVTDLQREALVAAREQGYFAVPRDTSAEELAADLDMSHQSLSELLRRGTANLVDATLVSDPVVDEEIEEE